MEAKLEMWRPVRRLLVLVQMTCDGGYCMLAAYVFHFQPITTVNVDLHKEIIAKLNKM